MIKDIHDFILSIINYSNDLILNIKKLDELGFVIGYYNRDTHSKKGKIQYNGDFYHIQITETEISDNVNTIAFVDLRREDLNKYNLIIRKEKLKRLKNDK